MGHGVRVVAKSQHGQAYFGVNGRTVYRADAEGILRASDGSAAIPAADEAEFLSLPTLFAAVTGALPPPPPRPSSAVTGEAPPPDPGNPSVPVGDFGSDWSAVLPASDALNTRGWLHLATDLGIQLSEQEKGTKPKQKLVELVCSRALTLPFRPPSADKAAELIAAIQAATTASPTAPKPLPPPPPPPHAMTQLVDADDDDDEASPTAL